LRTNASLRAAVIALTVTLVAGCGGAGHAGSAARTGFPEWRWPDADLSNTRHIASPIRAANVRRLHVAWTIPLGGGYAATPVVVDGIAYTADLNSNVYAIDLSSGHLKWRARYNLADTGPNGVNVADGRVFGVTSEDALALDARTGRQLWRTRLIRVYGELIVMTPGYHDGIVYVSTNPVFGGDIGTLWAIDARTGRRLWGWEEGPRSLWGRPEVNSVGGMWHPPAFDDRGALYISIVDPGPWPGTDTQPWGRSRPGPNRWSDSVVKLDARTGRFIWGTQAIPHDFYDWDLDCPVILVTLHGRRLALAAGKMGYVYALDAETGKLLWKRPVGLHNGHDQDLANAMHGDYSNIGYGKRMLPGDQGGVETQMATDGTTVYVPVNNLYAIYRRQQLPDIQDLEKGTGEIVALDIATGRMKWDHKFPHGMYGGATITNDLLFTTTFDGTAWALRRATGRVVWQASLPVGSISPVGISGDTVMAAGATMTYQGQPMKIVGFRLGTGG
jgi:outer membrane protein assembly factor BamB